MPRSTATMLMVVLLLVWPAVWTLGAAPAPWFEGFDTPNPSWREAGGDAHYTILQHRRVSPEAHTGPGSEWLQINSQNGSEIYFAHEVGRPWVIAELRPSVWVNSDHAGLQFIAEIVLRRTIDPRTNRPVVTHLYGSTYTEAGRWQQLTIDDLPRLLNRQLRILRSQIGANVDGREAYLNRILLNVYGGPGVTNLWIDDLEIAGHVSSGLAAAESPAAPARVQAIASATEVGPREPAPSRVQLAGSVLLVDGRPMFPRAIQYQGERLAVLKQLGFNTIWIRQFPATELLEEAKRLGLWVVCPPPRPPAVSSSSQIPVPPAPIGEEFQPVVAWDLGSGLLHEHLDANRQWAEFVKRADARQHRPLICSAAEDLRGYCRHVDLLLIDRRPLGTSQEMIDYGIWVRRQPLLARLGTPVWTTIQTQPSEGLRRQLAALDPGRPAPLTVGPEQIRLLVYTAISSGSRAVVFQSQSPLDADDPETRQRAATLRLLNAELDVIEPWVAAGTFVALAESNDPLIAGAVLRSDRARLVLPAWLGPGAQCVAPRAAANPLALLVPGVPESSSAYELTGGRLVPLRSKRETGGTRLTLDEFNLSGLVLLAQDPLIIDAVTHRAAANCKSSAELERQLAAQKLEVIGRFMQQFGRRAPLQTDVSQSFTTARQELQLCDTQLAAGSFEGATLHASRVMRSLRTIERVYWEVALKGLDSPIASPGTVSFATLPWHWRLVDRLANARPGPNRLLAGNFEDFNMMVQAGWRHYEHATAGISTAADLVVEARHSGAWGLRLTARADNPENPPATIEVPPVWITSAPVSVEAGQVVRIHGWVNIPTSISGSVDGLMIVDSLSGEDMAQRIDKTADWREFTSYRVVPQTGPMTVTFALSGLGEARLDDITIEVLETPSGAVGPTGPIGSPPLSRLPAAR